MTRFFSSALLALAVTGSVCAEQEYKLKNTDDWLRNGSVTFQKDCAAVKGRVMLASKQFFDIDPVKTYKLEVELKQTAGVPATHYVGFELFDKNGKAISVASATPLAKTDSVLAKPVKKGDTSLFIKANPNWLKVSYMTIAWNTKSDYSDLPNHNIAYSGINEVKTANGVTELVLSKPFTVDLPAGTSIRQHGAGGYMYTAGSGKASGEKFRKFSGKAKGQLKSGYNNQQWAVGAVKCRVIMLINWDGKPDCVTQFKDAELEIK